MRSYKEMLNDAANKGLVKEIHPDDAKAVKQCVLQIYQKIAEICNANNLTILLAGGSCLGAIRHQGFIPWDDDLDVMMPRPDYEKLIDLFEKGILDDEYTFRHPQGEEDSISMFLKVYYKNSQIVDIFSGSSKYPHGCFLDIFPLDGYSNNKIKRKLKGYLANSIRLISNMVYESEPLTESQKSFYKSDKESYRMMRYRRFLGKIFSIVKHQYWTRLFDRFVRNDNMKGLVGLPTGRKLYNGEVFPVSVYLPPVKASFEGIEVNIPNGYDVYLTNLYHNYMELPPVEKRESHFVLSVDLPKRFYE